MIDKAQYTISARDREILRKLAWTVADLANRPIEKEKRDLWYRHNALQDTRPLVFCSPENGWNEIITQEMLECEGEFARKHERELRVEAFWGSEMRDDRVIEPGYRVPHVFEDTGWGLQETVVSGGQGGSYTWTPPLKSYDDLDKLHFPRIIVDYDATNCLVNTLNAAFGDILPVRLRTVWWWSSGITHTAARLRGLDQIMFDMVDCPEGLHALMAFLRDSTLETIAFLEENGLFYPNNDGTYVGSGGFGWSHELPQPDFNGHVRPCDMWGFGESQETVGVSPDMFEEFIFPYQLPILEKFGLNCYGCCEALDKRWHVVKRFPRLMRVSVSPWSDVRVMAENLGDKYIFSWKPNPSDLAWPTFDEEHIRRCIRETLDATRGCRMEVIMKDCHTIGGEPRRATRWVQIAREESERLM